MVRLSSRPHRHLATSGASPRCAPCSPAHLACAGADQQRGAHPQAADRQAHVGGDARRGDHPQPLVQDEQALRGEQRAGGRRRAGGALAAAVEAVVGGQQRLPSHLQRPEQNEKADWPPPPASRVLVMRISAPYQHSLARVLCAARALIPGSPAPPPRRCAAAGRPAQAAPASCWSMSPRWGTPLPGTAWGGDRWADKAQEGG